jgi:hypothetical protein
MVYKIAYENNLNENNLKSATNTHYNTLFPMLTLLFGEILVGPITLWGPIPKMIGSLDELHSIR